jgi:hypothetical protein
VSPQEAWLPRVWRSLGHGVMSCSPSLEWDEGMRRSDFGTEHPNGPKRVDVEVFGFGEQLDDGECRKEDLLLI